MPNIKTPKAAITLVVMDQKYEDWLKSKDRGRMERTAPLAYEAGRGRMITRCARGPKDHILKEPALRRKTQRITHRTLNLDQKVTLRWSAESANVV